MDQAELWVEEIVVEYTLGAGAGDEAGPPFAGHELEGIAGLLGTEDADQPTLETLLADELLGPALLAERASAIEVCTASLLGEALGVFDEAVAVCRGEYFDEVAAPHLEHVIDEAFQFPWDAMAR